mgnify:CR=1 FL=1
MGLSPRVVIASPKPVGLSARRLRDAVLIERIGAIHRDNYCLLYTSDAADE